MPLQDEPYEVEVFGAKAPHHHHLAPKGTRQNRLEPKGSGKTRGVQDPSIYFATGCEGLTIYI